MNHSIRERLRRPEAVQHRIDRFLFELAELQRPHVRRHVQNLLDYHRKYERTRELTLHELVFESWKGARAASQVADAIAIAEGARPDDECVATRVEIGAALRRVCIEEAEGALIEEREIDRLARQDGYGN